MIFLSPIPIVMLFGLVSYFGIEVLRRFSVKRQWVDIPNERSSHKQPTPTGGGLVVAVLSIAAYSLFSLLLSTPMSSGYIAGALLVTAVSGLDDAFSISFLWRLLIHVFAAVSVVGNLGPYPIFGSMGYSGVETVDKVVTVMWIVWMINAYNFMDGIDGIAGVQALVASAAWVSVAVFTGQTSLVIFMSAVCGSTIGFLLLNWHPAKMFLGDVGSAFFGFTFASMPLLITRGSSPNASFITLGVLFLWPFIFDSTFTLIRRLARGEKVWNANRSHLYQQLVIAGNSHSIVSKMYGSAALFASAVGLYLYLYRDVFSALLISMLVIASIAFALFVLVVIEPKIRDRGMENAN